MSIESSGSHAHKSTGVPLDNYYHTVHWSMTIYMQSLELIDGNISVRTTPSEQSFPAGVELNPLSNSCPVWRNLQRMR